MGNQDVVHWLSANSRICSKHVETHSLAIEELTRRFDELEGKQGAAVGAVAEQVRDSEQRVLVAVAERFGNVIGSLGTRLDEAETGAEEIEKNMLNLSNSFDEIQSKFDTVFFSSLESNFADLRAEFRSHQAKINPPVACVPSRVMPRKSEKFNVTNTEKSKVSRSTASRGYDMSAALDPRRGAWACESCREMNFPLGLYCNRCQTPKPQAAVPGFGLGGGGLVASKSDAESFAEFLDPLAREDSTQDEIDKALADLGLPPEPRVPSCGNDKTEDSNPDLERLRHNTGYYMANGRKAENRRPKIDNKHKGLRPTTGF